jgi:hypothetical protein
VRVDVVDKLLFFRRNLLRGGECGRQSGKHDRHSKSANPGSARPHFTAGFPHRMFILSLEPTPVRSVK